MSAEKSRGIILRVVEFSESSCVVTLMTEDFGKITALAKGARRRKSPFEGAIDLLSLSHVVFLHKKTDALDLLTEAKLERRFRSAATDLNRLYAGFYVVELINAMIVDNDPHPGLFELADETLINIDRDASVPREIVKFELRALDLLGHRPMLNQCVECGAAKTLPTERVNFGIRAGGVYCPKCRLGKTGVVALSTATYDTMIRVLDQDTDAINWPTGKDGELRRFMCQYINHHLGYRPRTQKYISEI